LRKTEVFSCQGSERTDRTERVRGNIHIVEVFGDEWNLIFEPRAAIASKSQHRVCMELKNILDFRNGDGVHRLDHAQGKRSLLDDTCVLLNFQQMNQGCGCR